MEDENTKPDDQKPDETVVNGGQQVPSNMTNQDTQQSPAPEPNKEETTDDTNQKPDETKADETKDDNKKETPDLDTNVWGDTGSEVGNSVLKKLQESGISTEKAKALLYDAVQAGDPSKIDKDALVKELGEASANIVLTGIDNFIKENAAANEAVLKSVHAAVGGESNWNTLRDWAKTNLKPEEITEYIDLIDQGGLAARMAAKDLNERYEKAGNTSLNTAAQIVPQANNQQQQPDIQPLSAKEYFAACEKAHRDGTYETVKGKLLAGRNLGKQQGK